MQRDVCQPDDVFIVFRQLGVVLILEIIRVRLEMSMDSRFGVISVSLVHMLPPNHYGERDIRRQGQADDEPNRKGGHAHVIMATRQPCVKRVWVCFTDWHEGRARRARAALAIA